MNSYRSTRRMLTALCGIALALLVAGCGGGMDLAGGVGSGGTGATAFGPITGFGSVIVNGVRFEDSRAQLSDDGGQPLERDALALGMMVEVRGRIDAGGSGGHADAITTVTELRGPIDAGSLDLAAGRFSVLGFAVQAGEDTVLDQPSGLDALAPGTVVEVHGIADRTAAAVRATRIEREPSDSRLLVRGTIRAASADSFVIGPIGRPLLVQIGAAQREPAMAMPRDGLTARIEATSVPVAGVLQLQAQDRLRIDGGLSALQDGMRVELQGLVEAVGGGGGFRLLGIEVDAAAARFDDGLPTDVAPGMRIEVEGMLAGGVLIASRVEFTDRMRGGGREFEVSGTIERVTGAARFVVRGVAIDASGPGVDFRDGTAADLAVGRRVEVRGTVHGHQLRAVRIDFED
ncbi:MAG: hypothetical protein JSW68_03555 [Burkholderiales bacterium]|nr:MAG: hypothetical protein JSW68_03555 [Burkholderiales bacterium]